MTLNEAIEIANKAKAARESKGAGLPLAEAGSTPYKAKRVIQELPSDLYAEWRGVRDLSRVLTTLNDAAKRGLPNHTVCISGKRYTVVAHECGADLETLINYLSKCTLAGVFAAGLKVRVDNVEAACKATKEITYSAYRIGTILAPESKVFRMNAMQIMQVANQ
ncbi:MAG: hypothetical protein ACRCZM_05985 [Bacteroidales bacterium]